MNLGQVTSGNSSWWLNQTKIVYKIKNNNLFNINSNVSSTGIQIKPQGGKLHIPICTRTTP
jgi:hypothetical protein